MQYTSKIFGSHLLHEKTGLQHLVFLAYGGLVLGRRGVKKDRLSENGLVLLCLHWWVESLYPSVGILLLHHEVPHMSEMLPIQVQQYTRSTCSLFLPIGNANLLFRP